MFVAQLTTQQQGLLLQLGTELVAADGKIHDKEAELLAVVRAQMTPGIAPVSSDQLCKEFTTQASKAALLLELIGLAHADADYHSTEQSFVAQVANKLGIAKEMLEDMEAWVARQLALVREAEQFMEGK